MSVHEPLMQFVDSIEGGGGVSLWIQLGDHVLLERPADLQAEVGQTHYIGLLAHNMENITMLR
jgi:hypothetical protein